MLTDDPGARVHIDLQLTLNYGELYDGRPPPLDLEIRVTPSRGHPGPLGDHPQRGRPPALARR